MSVPGTYKNPEKLWTPAPVKQGFGTMGFLTQERGTYAHCWNDIQMAHTWMLMNDNRNYLDIRMGVDVCGQLNKMIRSLRGDWLWIMGDDHAFSHDLLPRLVAHDVDVVVPNCLRRNPPWQTVVNGGELPEDENGFVWQVGAALPEDELVEVWSAGSAGMLIKREVFDALEDPWFTPAPNAIGLNEDINFCRKVREAGFKIHCDSGAILGHIAQHVVYPVYREGDWHVDLVFDQNTTVPIRRLEEVPA